MFIRKNNQNNENKIIEIYRKANNFLIAMSGILIAFTTIVLGYNFVNMVSYNDKIDELKNNNSATQYMIIAENSNNEQVKLENYTLAIQSKQDNPYLYYMRAKLYYNQGQFEMALSDCKKAIKYDDLYSDAYKLQGKIYFQNRQYNMAIESFNKIAVEYDDETNFFMGTSYYYLEDFDSAVHCFEKMGLIEIPNELDGLYEMYTIPSKCYLRIGDTESARFNLSLLLDECKSDKDNIDIIANLLIETYIADGDFESSEKINSMCVAMHNQLEELQKQSIKHIDVRSLTNYELLCDELENRIY